MKNVTGIEIESGMYAWYRKSRLRSKVKMVYIKNKIDVGKRRINEKAEEKKICITSEERE